MRYNHESYLPLGAFQPELGRMRLHGGGGNPLDTFSDMIGTGGGDTGLLNMIDEGVQGASDVFATVDDAVLQPVTAPISQLTSALDEAVIQPITAPISDVGVAIDDAVADVIPGGWGTLAQVAAAIATMGQSIPIQAAAAAAAAAGSDYAKNKDVKSALEKGAVSGATRYGLGTLGEMASAPTDVLSADDAYMGKAMTDLSNLQPEAAVTSLIPESTVQSSPYGAGSVPYDTDVPVYYKGVQMTPEQVAADNPSLYANGQINEPGTAVYYGLPKEYRGLGEEGINQKYIAANAANATNVVPESADVVGDFIRQQNPDINGVPQRDLSTNFDSSKYPSNYSLEKIKELPGGLYDTAKNYVSSMSYPQLAMSAAGLYGLSNLAGGGGDEQQSQAQLEEEKKKIYTYGTAGQSSPNYLLKNRINASNVYSPSTGYRPLTRYAEGGEVQSFGIGGKISDAFTRVAQPFEKAILRPIGEAAPFLKDLAPYAGMAAGAMMGNPAMAAGIGGLASGFGKPGGFDMKRALMGGIAAYGMSNLAGGLEAAGAETALPPIDGASTVPDYYEAMRTANTPYTAEEAAKLIKPPTISRGTGIAPRDMFSLRDTDAMQRGVGNLLQNSNTPAYKDAMGALTSKVGIYNTGVPLVMGTTGMMGVDESNALKKEYDQATAQSQADEDKFKARVAAGKKRAQQAVSENPYMFADGGVINPPDDQTGMPNQTPMQKFEDGGIYNYAQGGMAPRFLSGGGDGMSDSIRANIEGSQEARLADGEFVIPADVVSHLGNGSSKAGAKQLYSMMDRVRKARTGNPKQGREIKPTKLMPV